MQKYYDRMTVYEMQDDQEKCNVRMGSIYPASVLYCFCLVLAEVKKISLQRVKVKEDNFEAVLAHLAHNLPLLVQCLVYRRHASRQDETWESQRFIPEPAWN